VWDDVTAPIDVTPLQISPPFYFYNLQFHNHEMPALGESKEWAFSGFFSFLVVNHQRRSNFDGLSVPWGAPRVISLKTLHPWGLLHHPTRDVTLRGL
jgi:hypothetical protein